MKRSKTHLVYALILALTAFGTSHAQNSAVGTSAVASTALPTVAQLDLSDLITQAELDLLWRYSGDSNRVRDEVIKATNRAGGNRTDPDVVAASMKMRAVDEAVRPAITKLINGGFWLKREGRNRRLDNAVFLVLQHIFDLKLVEITLKQLPPLIKAGLMDGGSYALMYDRYELMQGRAQIYGSQFQCKDGQAVVMDLLKPETVDERRKEVGLRQTLKEYLDGVQVRICDLGKTPKAASAAPVTATPDKTSVSISPRAEGDIIPDALMKTDGLYVGEIHGTNEVPQLILRLVEEALRRRSDPVAVSLELPASATDFNSAFWQGQDGRSSQAMKAMLAKLMDIAKANPRLTINYHAECLGAQPADLATINDFVNTCYARNLTEAAKGRFLIALSGNIHASRAETRFKTAASQLPASIVTVNVMALEGGSFWNNGEKTTAPQTGLHGLLGFLDVRSGGIGFDYIYVLKAFTASPPAGAQ